MRKICVALVALLGLVGCDLAVAFNADVTGLRVVEGDPDGGTEQVTDILELPKELEDFDIDNLKDMKEQGYTSKDIKSLILQQVIFTIKEGAENFDFVDSVEVVVGADDKDPVTLVLETEIVKGQNQVTLVAEPVELKGFATAKGAYMKASSVGQRPEKDVKVHAKAIFRVEILAGL